MPITQGYIRTWLILNVQLDSKVITKNSFDCNPVYIIIPPYYYNKSQLYYFLGMKSHQQTNLQSNNIDIHTFRHR